MSRHGESKLLRRVLGPGEPELTCEQCFEELDRYVEFELTGSDPEAQIPGMRAHLKGCGACAEDYESLKSLVKSTAGDAP